MSADLSAAISVGSYLFSLKCTYMGSEGARYCRRKAAQRLHIIFFGGASYHLYFLSLLFWCSAVAIFIRSKYRRLSSLNIIFCFLISLLIAEWTYLSGNSFQLRESATFQSSLEYFSAVIVNFLPIRTVLVVLAWIITCFPYIFSSI